MTNSDYLHERIFKIKGQGLAKYREYWHDTLGFNFRMTNIQAAIGLAQFEQVDKFIDKKRQVANWYKRYLKGLPVEFHDETENVKHTYWMNSILVENADLFAKYLIVERNQDDPNRLDVLLPPDLVNQLRKVNFLLMIK